MQEHSATIFDQISLAFMLMLVIEGLIYAIFPSNMKKMMAYILSLSCEQIRMTGLGLAVFGAIGVWLYTK